jgi:hypothetical protein
MISLTYRRSELYGVLSDHSGYAPVGTVAAEVTGVHLAIVLSPNMLDGNDAVGYVQLKVAAAGWVYDDHYGNSIIVLVTD